MISGLVGLDIGELVCHQLMAENFPREVAPSFFGYDNAGIFVCNLTWTGGCSL